MRIILRKITVLAWKLYKGNPKSFFKENFWAWIFFVWAEFHKVVVTWTSECPLLFSGYLKISYKLINSSNCLIIVIVNVKSVLNPKIMKPWSTVNSLYDVLLVFTVSAKANISRKTSSPLQIFLVLQNKFNQTSTFIMQYSKLLSYFSFLIFQDYRIQFMIDPSVCIIISSSVRTFKYVLCLSFSVTFMKSF